MGFRGVPCTHIGGVQCGFEHGQLHERHLKVDNNDVDMEKSVGKFSSAIRLMDGVEERVVQLWVEI